MRLGALLAAAVLVLVTLVSAFPQVVSSAQPERSSSNTSDHMDFTRELADHTARLDILRQQHEAMAGLPERMVRIEERLGGVERMVWAILAGIAALLVKEVAALGKAIRRLAPSGRTNEGG